MGRGHGVSLLLVAAGVALLVLGVTRYRDDALPSAYVALAMGCSALLVAYWLRNRQDRAGTGDRTRPADGTVLALAVLGFLGAVAGLVLSSAGAPGVLAGAALCVTGGCLVLAVTWVQVRA